MPNVSMLGRGVLFALTLFTSFALAGPATAQSNDILIGESVVLTGPMAENGILYNKGISLYIDAVNADGGVHGRQIKLLVADDAYNPDKAKENTLRFINKDKVVALFGYTGTGVTLTVAPLAEQAGIPLIAPYTGATQLHEKTVKHLFMLRANYADEMHKMVEHLTTLGTRNIAIAYQDDGFGRSGLKSAEEALAAFGLKPAAVGAITAGTYEAVQAAATISAVDPAAIILASAGKASVNFIRAYRASDKNAQFLGLSVVSSTQLLDELGAEADGVIITQVVPSPRARSLPIVRDFQRAAKAKNVEITHTAFEGYIAAHVLVEALQRAGPELSPAHIVTALESMNKVNLGGFIVSFSPDQHSGSNYVDISMVRSTGEFVQ